MALKEDYLSDLAYRNKVVEMYELLNIDLTKYIILTIKKEGDISSYSKAQMRQLIKRGGKDVFLNSLEETSRLTAKRKKELNALFEELAKEDIESYKELYDYRGKKMLVSESQYKLLNKQAKMTEKEFKNFTRSIAFSSQKDFINTLEKKDYIKYLLITNNILLLSPIIILALLVATIYSYSTFIVSIKSAFGNAYSMNVYPFGL